MVQAGLTPTSVRDSITGAETEPSTNQGGGSQPELSAAGRRRGRQNARGEPKARSADRRYFIGGSDARIIMGNDEAAVLRPCSR